MAQTLILGIGNLLLTDDGAGIHAARRLATLLATRPDVSVLDAGTLSFTLAPIVESADRLVVLDAAQLHQAPGAVQSYRGAEFDAFLGRSRLTVHELGLRDVMDVIRLAGLLPRERVLIAIQPETITWGMELTPVVAAGVASMIACALDLLDSWSEDGPAAGSRATHSPEEMQGRPS